MTSCMRLRSGSAAGVVVLATLIVSAGCRAAPTAAGPTEVQIPPSATASGEAGEVLLPPPPVFGSVRIEDGRCCTGGIAGQPLEINVAFEAASPAGEVTEMRVRTGSLEYDEAGLADAEWEPFVPSMRFTFVPPINWIGYYVSVQFRDNTGNVSPVYSDDISVEGMPGRPPDSSP